MIQACGVQRRFIHQVGEIRSRKSGSASGDDGDIDIFGQRNLSHVNGENSFAALDIRTRYNNAAVETSGTQQRRIENIGPVCRGNQNDTFVGFEAVHFNQQLVERLLTFVVAAAKTRATMPPNRVDLIDKDDAGSVFLSLFE